MTTTEQDTVQLRRLMEAEPMAGFVTLKFFENLMDLNPALRPPVKRAGVDELELWQAVQSVVQPAGSDAWDMPGAVTGDDARRPGGSSIGEALLWTLESCFREDFTPEARGAWETLYRFVNESGRALEEPLGA